MIKPVVVYALLLSGVGPLWAAPKPASAPGHDAVIYARGSVRIHGAANGGVIVYAAGRVRVRGTAGGAPTVIVTKPRHTAA